MSSTLSIFKHTEVVEKTLPFRRMQSQGHRLEGKMPGLCGEWEVELKCPQGVRTGGLRPRWHGAGVPACCVKTSRPLQEEGAHPGAVSSTDRGEKTPPTASGCCLRCGAQFLTRCAVRSLELRNASRKQPRIRPWWGQRGNTTPPTAIGGPSRVLTSLKAGLKVAIPIMTGRTGQAGVTATPER